MLKLGYKLMSEEHGPADLVRNTQRAEQAGFDFAAIPITSPPGSRSKATRRWPGRAGRGEQCDAPDWLDDGGDLPEHARKTVHRFFRWSVAGWPVMAELPDTEGFAAASKHVSPEAVGQPVSCGPSPERHLEAIHRYVRAGYDHIILVQVGPQQNEFIEFYERHLAPALRTRQAA
jgi:hypothetical protein